MAAEPDVAIEAASITKGEEYRENISKLVDHPKNNDVYVDTDISDIVDSLEEHGYVEYEKIVVTNVEWEEFDWPTPRVISGHRRKHAAGEVGLKEAPVVEVEPSSPQEELRLLLLENRYRNKTRAEKINEGELWEEIEELEAKQREKATQIKDGEPPGTQKFGDPEKGETVEKVGEKVGVSGETYRQGKRVKEIAEGEKDAPEPVREEAQRQWKKLETDEQSYHGAYSSVREVERKTRERNAAEATQRALTESIKESDVKDLRVSRGQTWKLGDHILYCGDSASDEFRELVSPCEFAFADPPYNAGAAEWDHEFEWNHDWLNDTAEVVAVTPGIGSLFDFARTTSMPYQWSVACWIANGRARGKMGYGNWVQVLVFSDDSIHRNSQDIVKVTIKESEKDESHHRGRKFPRLMTWLFERYCHPGKTVVDPFLGSGTTLLAAESSGRVCVGAEIVPAFCEQIISRWETLTGETAVVV